MIVEKAVNMAKMMNVPILGLVENMSYVTCPECGHKIEIFGKSHAEEVAAKNNMPLLARIPVDPKLASACDAGLIELFVGDWLDKIPSLLDEIYGKKEKHS